MIQKRLAGLILALPTPLLKNEDIDKSSLNQLIDYCISEGANGIMILGTMGEGVGLIDREREILLASTVNHTAKRIPVLATISAASTRKSIEYAKQAEELGVDYIVSTSAFYNKFPDQKSQLYHIESISDSVETPTIYYNAPGFTGNQTDVDTLDKILNLHNVSGIKDSSCNFSNFSELLRRYPEKESRPGTIMQGDETVFDASLMMGADGIISGGGVLFINLLIQLLQAAEIKDLKTCMQIQKEFSSLLMNVLLPNPQRNWMANIKQQLVQKKLFQHATVTAPFLL